MADFSIRQVTKMSEIHGIVEIQRQAWAMPDLEIVPTFEMKAVSDFGVVLVAVDHSDTPIGFIYAFPEFPNYHYSHMMATIPSWSGKGVGYALKKYHYNLAKSSEFKIKKIRWTVDPLLPNNAFLNFAKLGAVCSKYYVNYYGDPEKIGIYKGVPTDRFLLEWNITDPVVEKRMLDFKAFRITKTELFERSPPLNQITKNQWVEIDNELAKSFSVQVPHNYQDLKNVDLTLAIEWRMKFRDFCLDTFRRGWQVDDYHSFVNEKGRENYYEFNKKRN